MTLDVQRISGTYAKTAARLCNFETGKSYLLPAHQEYLDNEVRNVIQTMKWPWVDVYGYASRAGDAAFNMALSNQRMNAVKSRIEQYATQVNFKIQNALGESQSGPNERNNDGYYRAVEVYVFAHKPPKPKPPRPTPTLRRIDFRSFFRLAAKGDGPPGEPKADKEASEAVKKLGLELAKGEVGRLGSETSRRVSEFRPDFRVTRVNMSQRVTYDTMIGGEVTTKTTNLSYEWGPPTPFVTKELRYEFVWDKKPYSSSTTTETIPRREAEKSELIVPPDPK